MKRTLPNLISLVLVPWLAGATALGGCESTKKEKNATASGQPLATSSQAQTAQSTPGAAGAQIPEHAFDIDPSLLGLTYEDAALGIRFAPPAGWPPLEAALMEQTQQAYEKFAKSQQDDQFVSRPVRMFYEKDKRFFMILSSFASWPAPMDPITAMDTYRRRVAARMPNTVLQDGIYRHGKLVIYHILLSNEIMANTRLVVIQEGHAPIQIDYLVPMQTYAGLTKTLEASIGSIQPL